jgi:uncharacterized protein
MSQDKSAAIQQTLQKYMVLFSQQRWDEWIDLWADDGVLEFPFAPPGRRSRYVGKPDILAYMKPVAVRMTGRIKTELDYLRVHPMRDPGMTCLEMGLKGHVIETGAPYYQKYISIVEMKGGKLSLYREYWNPIVSMDANGGRDAWTAAFGMPEQENPAS